MDLTVAALLAVIISTIHEPFCGYHGLLKNKNVFTSRCCEATTGKYDTDLCSLISRHSLDFIISHMLAY